MQRAISVDGAVNLRDLGGYPTADGGRVRPGRLYRSGSLVHLTALGRREFHGLGIALICDLRRPEELQEEPTPLPVDHPQRLHIPIDPGSAVAVRSELIGDDLDLTERIAFMNSLMAALVREHAQDYAAMFEALLRLEEGGFLVHCTAGKDRTGVACALILHALGVDQAMVVEDYLLTNAALDVDGYILPLLARKYGLDADDRETALAIAGVRAEYLHAAYDAMHEEFDGVDHYIERAIGLDGSKRDALRQRFVRYC